MSNVNLFKRYDRAQDAMMRATMPRAAETTDSPVRLFATVEEVAVRNGSRLVRVKEAA